MLELVVLINYQNINIFDFTVGVTMGKISDSGFRNRNFFVAEFVVGPTSRVRDGSEVATRSGIEGVVGRNRPFFLID